MNYIQTIDEEATLLRVHGAALETNVPGFWKELTGW
jgi:hypothetical protein